MARILTSQASTGNVLKYELAPEVAYCRTNGVYTKNAESKVGMVVTLTGGKWINFLDANAGDAIGVLVDELIYGAADGDVAGTAILNDGPAIVRQGGLVVPAAGATLATAITALETAGIKVAGKFSTDEIE
jgi:hypothetical protein